MRRSGGDNWAASKESLSKLGPAPNPGVETQMNVLTFKVLNLPATAASTMAENVKSFFNGIRASFRSDNVNVMSPQKQRISNPF